MPFRLTTRQISYLHAWVRTAHRSSLDWQRNCVAERRGIHVDATACQIHTSLVWNCFVCIPILCPTNTTIRPFTSPRECDTIKRIYETRCYTVKHDCRPSWNLHISSMFTIINQTWLPTCLPTNITSDVHAREVGRHLKDHQTSTAVKVNVAVCVKCHMNVKARSLKSDFIFTSRDALTTTRQRLHHT